MKTPFSNKWSLLFKLRVLWISILLILAAILAYWRIIPNGQVTYSRQWPAAWHSGNGFISGFQPAIRLDLADRTRPKIIGEPIYFSVMTPRTFNKATVTVEYQNHLSSSTPVIELGLLKDRLTQGYDLKPIQNKVLDRLYSSGWHTLASSSPLILEKGNYYDSSSALISDLKSGNLKNCPLGPSACLAVYNYPVDYDYKLQPDLTHPVDIDQPLRGPHQFYLYLPSGRWDLSLSFSYLSKEYSDSPITVNIWSGSHVIASKSLSALTGSQENDNFWERMRSLDFSGSLSKGALYKVEVKIGDGTIINNIKSSSDKLAFIHRVWPVNRTGALNLYTDASSLRLQTNNPASLGEASFGTDSFDISQAYKPFFASSSQSVNQISLPHGDIILQDNGVFSFDRSSLFSPEIKDIEKGFEAGPDLKYIIASYRLPRRQGRVYEATADFDLSGVKRKDGSYDFVVSIPGLDGMDKDSYLTIKKITVSFQGKTLWKKIGL